jgi:putative Mg2+ transporter-C (MgtC) family protein
MSDDVALQVNVALRLLIAAGFGALVGIEREIHGHTAGFRTHSLVSVGAAMFTVLSIYGFPSTPENPVDPTRIAAQIVTGIGFLGAGAILKAGPTVQGLTTAASLWSVAAIGMAAGAGAWIVAAVGTAIVVFVLWPLNLIAKWLDRQPTRPGSRDRSD